MRAKTGTTIYWALLVYEHWNIHVAATAKGLCYVGPQNAPLEELTRWAESRLHGCQLVQDRDALQPYTTQLAEYFQHGRKRFTVPFDLRGTPFQIAVWEALSKIPYGQIRAYSDIAHDIQRQTAVRAVGAAIGANPALITIPCHRVIGKNGKLTGYRGGLDMKQQLLRLEHENAVGATLEYLG